MASFAPVEVVFSGKKELGHGAEEVLCATTEARHGHMCPQKQDAGTARTLSCTQDEQDAGTARTLSCTQVEHGENMVTTLSADNYADPSVTARRPGEDAGFVGGTGVVW